MYLLKPLHKLPSLRGEEEVCNVGEGRERERGGRGSDEEIQTSKVNSYPIRKLIQREHWIVWSIDRKTSYLVSKTYRKRLKKLDRS